MLSSALLAISLLSSPASAQDFHDNVIIVLDASGSMTEELSPGVDKMDGAVQAIKTVVGQLPESTRVGVVVFSASNVDDGWLFELQERDDAELFRRLDGVQPNGGTPLGHFLKFGGDRMLEVRQSEHGYGTYRLLVVTDGEASDNHKVDKFAPDIVNRGVGLDVIGVKMEREHTLKKVADSYRSADNPEQLVQAVREVLAEVPVTDDAAGAAVYAELDGLPDAFALALLESLSFSGNHPIGEKPPPPPPPPGSEPQPDADVPVDRAPPPPACDAGATGAGWLAIPIVGLFLRRRRRP